MALRPGLSPGLPLSIAKGVVDKGIIGRNVRADNRQGYGKTRNHMKTSQRESATASTLPALVGMRRFRGFAAGGRNPALERDVQTVQYHALVSGKESVSLKGKALWKFPDRAAIVTARYQVMPRTDGLTERTTAGWERKGTMLQKIYSLAMGSILLVAGMSGATPHLGHSQLQSEAQKAVRESLIGPSGEYLSVALQTAIVKKYG